MNNTYLLTTITYVYAYIRMRNFQFLYAVNIPTNKHLCSICDNSIQGTLYCGPCLLEVRTFHKRKEGAL